MYSLTNKFTMRDNTKSEAISFDRESFHSKITTSKPKTSFKVVKKTVRTNFSNLDLKWAVKDLKRRISKEANIFHTTMKSTTTGQQRNMFADSRNIEKFSKTCTDWNKLSDVLSK